MGARYQFTDVWMVDAPLDVAWRMVDDVGNWPRWWPDYREARIVSPAGHGAGARWHVRVKSNLPYTVDFDFTVLEHRPPEFVRVRTEGFFEGEIDWRLEPASPGRTRLTLHERTETRWALINLTASLGGRRLLEWNHRAAMRRGEAGFNSAIARGYLPPDLDVVSKAPPIR